MASSAISHTHSYTLPLSHNKAGARFAPSSKSPQSAVANRESPNDYTMTDGEDEIMSTVEQGPVSEDVMGGDEHHDYAMDLTLPDDPQQCSIELITPSALADRSFPPPQTSHYSQHLHYQAFTTHRKRCSRSPPPTNSPTSRNSPSTHRSTGKHPSPHPHPFSPLPLASQPRFDLDPDDDGYGINGIGYRPTPQLAHARAQKRKQQIVEWRMREAREARQRRSERRAVGGVVMEGVVSGDARVGLGTALRPTNDRRAVRFAQE